MGEGEGKRRTYTAAPSTFCGVACILFWIVMREVSCEGISPGFPLEPEVLFSGTDVARFQLFDVDSRDD